MAQKLIEIGETMRPQTPKQPQVHLFKHDLLEQITPDAPLLRLGRAIPWGTLEEHLAPLYALTGRPAKPVRLMVGLLILKQLENLSDERVVEQWVQNPYFQAFCGERFFQWKFPCDPSDLTYFCKRIGEKGCEEIFKHSVRIHGDKALEPDVVVDTTVQEKNITFPTDTKMHCRIIGKILSIAKRGGIKLYRTYAKEVRGLMSTIRFAKSSNHLQRKAVCKNKRRLKTIAGELVREVQRKLLAQGCTLYRSDCELFLQVR